MHDLDFDLDLTISWSFVRSLILISNRNPTAMDLILWGQVRQVQVCVTELGHHWFRLWLVACLVPCLHLDWWWLIVSWARRKKKSKISQTPDIVSLVDAAWKHPKYPWFCRLLLEFAVNIDTHKHENSEVLYSNRNKSPKEMSGNFRLQIRGKHTDRFHLTKCTNWISHTNHFISL